MKICLISIDDWTYDCNSDHVIVARDTDEVIKLAQSVAADEGKLIWYSAKISIIGDYTGDKTEPFILLTSFHAG